MKKGFVFLALLMSMTGQMAAQDLTSVDLYLRDIDGDEHSFQEYLEAVRTGGEKGAVFISFWAMWCEPCKQEMKALKSTYEKFKDKNFHYLAINLDNPRSIAKVKAYVRAQQLPYDFWLDPNSEVFKKLNGQSMPYSLLVNQDGELITKRAGYIAGDEHEIEEDIKKILE
ncbi:MAG: TlpA family protein disulfide reductase [Bacteroidetes bacterium]|nr:TlpA family protein disulfide reductase [Bacteroidota bacterium]